MLVSHEGLDYVSERNTFEQWPANSVQRVHNNSFVIVCVCLHATSLIWYLEMSNTPIIGPKNAPKSQLSNQESKNTSQIDRRNESERKRRNRFNGYIDELAGFIADKCTTKRSKAKSSILRLTIEYFCEQEKAAKKALKQPFGNDKPAYITNDELSFAFMESACAFIFAVDLTGKVIYSSDNVFASIGHLPGHIINRSVFEIIQPKDQPIFQEMLSALKSDSALTMVPIPSSENGVPRISQRLEPFLCQFCQGPRGRRDGFEFFYCFPVMIKNFVDKKNAKQEFPDCIYIMAKPLNRVAFNTTLLRSDGPQREFTAVLNIEAKYDHVDKRVALVLGYFPSELMGRSLYDFCHFEDLDVLAEYHNILLLRGRITTCYYRHLTKGQSWIWLQSRYHISYSDWSSKPQAVTSLSWAVPYEEVCEKQEQMLARDREEFALIQEVLESADGKSISSNDSSKFSVADVAGVPRESVAKRRRRTGDSSRSVSVSSMEETPRSENLMNNNYEDNADMKKNELIEFERFLQSLDLSNASLSGAQQDLHRLLVEKHTRLLNDIHKQTKELEVLQKQIQTQGEVHKLIERLEEAKTANEKELEITIAREILNKFEEIRRVSPGPQTEENRVTTSEQSLASSSSRLLREIGAVNSPHTDQRSPFILPGEQMTENTTEKNRNCALTEEKESLLPPWQNDVFLQDNWIQKQAEQVQLQQQETLMQQICNTGFIPQQQTMMMLGHVAQQQQQQLMQWQGHGQPHNEVTLLNLSQEQFIQSNNFDSYPQETGLLNIFGDIFLG